MAEESSIITINNIIEFEQVLNHANDNNYFILMDAYATWCGPCMKIAPLFDQLSNDINYNDYVLFTKLDVDTAKDVASLLNITQIPSFFLFYKKNIVKLIQDSDINNVKKMLDENKQLINS